jgi:hypothetical protein
LGCEAREGQRERESGLMRDASGLWNEAETDKREVVGDGTKRLFEILPRFMGRGRRSRPLSAMSG